MEHLDAHGGSLIENPANVRLADREDAELDRALAHAIRQLIADFCETAAPTA